MTRFKHKIGQVNLVCVCLLLGLIFLNTDYFIFSLYFFLFAIIYPIWILNAINESKKPSPVTPEEIEHLKESLESKKVKDYIIYLHQTKHEKIYKIAKKVDRKFKLDLYHKKGRLKGNLKVSLKLKEKISHILGYKDFRDYWENFEILGRFSTIDVSYNFSNPNSNHKLTPEMINKRRTNLKFMEQYEIEKIASNYYDLENYEEALKWYENHLKFLSELGEHEYHNIMKIKAKIEKIKYIMNKDRFYENL